MTTTRYGCIVDGCGWHHDEPTGLDAPQWPAGAQSVEEAAHRAAIERAIGQEPVFRAHLESHDVIDFARTIRRLRRD